jgi:hypothetical protein
MADKQLRNEIMVTVNKFANPMIDHSCFPSESAHSVDYAIEQLFDLGLIEAKYSSTDIDNHWTAYGITTKGKIYMEEEGLN